METRADTGGNLEFSQPVVPGENRRFWRIECAEDGF
jgi:hypothetical protein